MSKFQKSSDGKYLFFCPGCQMSHFVKADGVEPTWTLTGLDKDAPTVKPSIRVRYGQNSCCHSFVTDGKIRFLSDCTHSLAGRTVEIPDFDED